MSTKKERQGNFFNVCCKCEDGCCRHARPPITRRRQKIIEAHLKTHKASIENPFTKTAYTFPREDAEGYCIFYDKKAMTCVVHAVKPETCVAGPVTFDISIPKRTIEWHLKMGKICPLAGKLYKDNVKFEQHLKSAKREILELVQNLDSEALKAILRIEEPETIKITEDKIEKDILDKLTS